jgi:hypothetical protein
VVANRSTQDRIRGLERVEYRALGDLAVDLDLHLGLDVRQRPQVRRKNDSDHCSV